MGSIRVPRCEHGRHGRHCLRSESCGSDLQVLIRWPLAISFQIKALGGLKAIVISHPHYYTTHLEWARIFGCPVYLSSEDQSWLNRPLTSTGAEGVERRFITTDTEEIVPGVTAIKLGGHFPGSLVLHWDNKLFVADTLVTIPVCLFLAVNVPRKPRMLTMRAIGSLIHSPPCTMSIASQAQRRLPFSGPSRI